MYNLQVSSDDRTADGVCRLSSTQYGFPSGRSTVTALLSVTHTLIELVEYLIDNIYVSVGNRVIGSVWAFQWVQIVHLCWLIFSCFIMNTDT